MTTVVEAIVEMYTAIPVRFVVGLERSENPEFYSGCISILLHRSNNLDGHEFISFPIVGLDNFAKCALTK